MDVRIGSKSASPVRLNDVAEGIAPQVRRLQDEWLAKLAEHPERFGQLEQEIHNAFAGLADQLVAGLLAEADKAAAMRAAQKKSWLRRLFRFALPRSAR
jgi:hypothetical protein